jgi:flagellar FliL protein
MASDNTHDSSANDNDSKRNRGAVVGAIIGGLLVGALAGAFVFAPRLRGSPQPAKPSHDAEAPASAHGEAAAPPTVYTLDNLVLNPAQTAGTRFLMVSVALELNGATAQQAVQARDAEVRDAILRTLGGKTIAELSNIALRDSIRSELQTSLATKFPAGTIRRIYFPQFVIQ